MKNFFKSKFFGALIYLASIQVIVFIFLFLYRLVFLTAGYENTIYADNKWLTILHAFFLSLRFDNMVASYILVIPLTILPLLAICNIFSKKILYIFNIYYILIYSVVFAVSCMDIPYFQYFFRHINASIFNWMEYGNETAGMILEEKSYYLYFLLYVVSVLLFSSAIYFIARKISGLFTYRLNKKTHIVFAFAILLIGYTLCHIGTKGRIRGAGSFDVQHAYFSENSFINQMAITPVFYLYKSMGYNKPNTEKELMNPVEALELAGEYLNTDFKHNAYSKRRMVEDSINNPHNIVLVLIESFADNYLHMEVNGTPLMPYMQKLISGSCYYFDNFYSQGTHTNQGIVSSLYGFPSLFERHMMKSLDINNFGRIINLNDEFQDKNNYPAPIYNGLPKDLSGRGYETMFFTTHIARYDNGQSLFLNNGIKKLFSQESYPESSWVNVWGVNDGYLLEYALSEINNSASKGKPFFAGMMTISNHPPYTLPQDFSNLPLENDQKAMVYTDHCIEKFMEEASRKDWYNNTIFIFLGDHGKIIGTSTYEIPLSLNHVPLIIHSPLFEGNDPKIISNPAGQIDIYPTVMGLLNTIPVYNSFGIDVIKNERDCIYFTSDDKLGCVNNKYLYVYNMVSDQEFLYDLDTQKNVISNKQNILDSMRDYSFSMIESAKYILKNDLEKSN